MQPSSAAVNGTDARSYFERGVAMYNDKNYDGCIDQLLQMRNLDPTAADREDALYYIAMSSLYCGDDEAIDLLRRFLAQYPESPKYQEISATSGDYHFTRGDYGDALNIYLSVNADGLTADRREDLYYRTAYSHMMLGENDKALAMFDRLSDSRQYANAAKFYKAYIAYARRDYTTARHLFSEVDQTRDPGQAARYYLCQLDFLDGNYDNAYSESVALLATGSVNEFSSELQRIAGESLYNLGRTGEAIPYLRQYIASGNDVRPSAYYMLGVSEYDSGQYSEAISMLQKAAGDTDITGQSAYLYLGQSYIKAGDTDAAMLAFEKASQMSFDDRICEVATYNYIVSRMDGGRVPFANSVGMLNNFLHKYPHSTHANAIRESLVSGYMSDSDYDNALRILNETPTLSPRMLQAKQRILFMLGTRFYQNGDAERALDFFNEGASINAGAPEVWRQCRLWAANANYDLENYDEAADGYLVYLQSAPLSDENRVTAYYNLGYTRLRQQRYDDAMTDFIKVADNNDVEARTRADAYNRAADCLYCRHEFDKATTYYSKAYNIYPQAGDYALFQQAEMSGYRRDYRTRINLLDQMLSRFPSSALAADAMLAKAESNTALGNRSEAIAIYEETIACYPSASQGRRAALMLAVNRLDDSDLNGAMEAYRNVVEMYPTSSEARLALDDLKQLYADEGRLPDYVVFVNSVPEISKVDISEFESEAFAAAEDAYFKDKTTDRLHDYIAQYPDGANMPDALLYLAETASGNGDTEKACTYSSKIIERYPDSEQAENALYIKAENESAQGKGEIALASYRQLERRASSPDMLNSARIGILLTAIDLNRYDDVLEVSEQIIATSAANAELYQVKFYRALALDRCDRQDEAYEIWEQLAKDPSNLYGSKSAVYMIESLINADKTEQAEKMANEFIDAGSPHEYWYARGFIAYSDILRLSGRTFEANEYLKTLRANYLGNEADIFEMIETRLDN